MPALCVCVRLDGVTSACTFSQRLVLPLIPIALRIFFSIGRLFEELITWNGREQCASAVRATSSGSVDGCPINNSNATRQRRYEEGRKDRNHVLYFVCYLFFRERIVFFLFTFFEMALLFFPLIPFAQLFSRSVIVSHYHRGAKELVDSRIFSNQSQCVLAGNNFPLSALFFRFPFPKLKKFVHLSTERK